MDTLTLYGIIALVQGILIVVFSSVALYCGISYLRITKMKKKFDWVVLMQTIISFGWVVLFGYIVEETMVSTSPTVIGSFGSLFIRPMVLLTSVSISIWMNIRYKLEKTEGVANGTK